MAKRNRREEEDYDDDDDIDIRRRDGAGEDLAMRMLVPVGLTGWAILAGYLALFSVLCLPAPFALIAGIMAIRAIRRNPGTHGMGRAIFGIVMGGIGTVMLLSMLIGMAVETITKGQ